MAELVIDNCRMDFTSPTPQAVVAARLAAGQTQAEAAKSVGLGSHVRWSEYEREDTPSARQMDGVRWGMYLLLTDQHPAFRLVKRRVSKA